MLNVHVSKGYTIHQFSSSWNPMQFLHLLLPLIWTFLGLCTSCQMQLLKWYYTLMSALCRWGWCNKSVNFQCGVDVTSRCTFPIIGRFHGPGGMFRDGLVFISFLPSFSTTIMERKKGKIIRANELSIWESMMTKVSSERL